MYSMCVHGEGGGLMFALTVWLDLSVHIPLRSQGQCSLLLAERSFSTIHRLSRPLFSCVWITTAMQHTSSSSSEKQRGWKALRWLTLSVTKKKHICCVLKVKLWDVRRRSTAEPGVLECGCGRGAQILSFCSFFTHLLHLFTHVDCSAAFPGEALHAFWECSFFIFSSGSVFDFF